jgi:ribonuclease HII
VSTAYFPDIVTLGIDEAGRGPVIGPMVMAGVALRTRKAAALSRAGVADSKAFGAGEDAHKKRAELARRIRDSAESVVVKVIDVETIDRRVQQQKLNHLEREIADEIIKTSASAKRIVADGEILFSSLASDYPHLEAKNRGEDHHVAVAAASILAKVERDENFFAIARRYEPEFGPIAGGGYDNAATHRFLEKYVAAYGCLPPEARKSWGGAAARLQLKLF